MTIDEQNMSTAPTMSFSSIDFTHRFNVTFDEDMVSPEIPYPLEVY